MANNAYVGLPGAKGWLELGDDWQNTAKADGFRGHVFATSDNKTVVLSIKGTSVPVVSGGGPTSRKDKLNDNLLFSCCCAKVGPTWSPVCGCHAGGWKCDNTCVQRALAEESLFYPVGTNLYNNITFMYPNANIWLVGHSLGGSLASLLGVTFGSPVVAFEAPSERMAARRLHLPLPRTTEHIIHLYNTADPIPMGTCTGVLSTCASAGYAMEGRCHLGKKIVYDTISKWKWSSSVQNHVIGVVIDKLLAQDWDDAPPDVPPLPRRAVPEAVVEDDDCDASVCTECYGWEFGEFGKL
ncbi:alpha/beta-hydrolase [Auriculariales sp. MPI-PUGE-AT-0066]|nr:alpha/beta-hydrolase [Auriculariales sp. MPI-PUGE-AT-0066]